MDTAANNQLGGLLVAIPLLPLAAALIGYLLAWGQGRLALRLNAWLGGLALLASGGLAGWLLSAVQQSQADSIAWRVPWLALPDAALLTDAAGNRTGLPVPLAFNAGVPALLFALTTAVIAVVVLVFAVRERRDDPRRATFFATLTLFAGSMLLFLAADTLLVIYIAWELMGLTSYLLIAHPGTDRARRAARQAFWTTRATDFGLLFAVFTLMTVFRWTTLSGIDLTALLQSIASQGGNPREVYPWLSAVALLVLAAVLGKAAQFPLSFWLSDAMVAPAPVSALLHAATMVAAGPYLLTRLHGFFVVADLPLLAATLLGGLTLLTGAIMALAARDPKRVLAYSTVSHLGLVVMSVGVLAEEAGYYHLLAHAWFKAALFLGVGYLVAVWLTQHGGAEADHEPPELDRLAGFARRQPLVLWGVLVPAGLSLAGLFPLAGALGKEQIFQALLTRYGATPQAGIPAIGEQFPVAAAAWAVGACMLVIALPLTAAYITRLVGILGWGRPAPQPPEAAVAAVAAPRGWGVPLVLTTLLALMGSVGWAAAYFNWYNTPAGFAPESAAWKWSAAGHTSQLVSAVALAAVLIGAGLTWYLRVARPQAGDRVFREGGLAALAAFFRHGMYLRELFHLVIGRCGELLAVLAGRADVGLLDWLVLRLGGLGRLIATAARWVDDYIVDGLRWLACEFWWFLKRLHARTMQTGQIQHYMFIVLLGTALLCLVILRPLSRILADILGSI
ncbi:hypothetical protein JW859_10810 [bacterium]|nr:hypothetical protein [bacterium]